jgi:glyoxylase-like metal-dependent hydrolase (beta-lactamase superfamily II)
MLVHKRIAKLLVLFLVFTSVSWAATSATLEQLSDSVYLYRDICNVYIIEREGHTLAIDFGSGDVLDALKKKGWKAPDWVLHTHHHRDQCQGDYLLAGTETRIAVPEKERHFFEKAKTFWRDKKIFHNYLFKPDPFTSAYNIPVERGLAVGDELEWRGLTIKAITARGHTMDQLAYALSIDGKRIVFSGDVIYGPGKLWNYHCLQYRYNDCGQIGRSAQKVSRDAIMAESPDLLAPSHGVLMNHPAKALDEMLTNLSAVISILRSERIPPVKVDRLPHLTRVKAISHSYLIESDDGYVFLVDAGNTNPMKTVDENPNQKKIEGIWPTHYHGDHMQGINETVEKHGSKVYCHEILKEVLENPSDFNIPCLVRKPIQPDRVLGDGETFNWRGIEMRSYFFPGQTHFHAGLLATIDGKRVFFTGDSFDSPEHGHNYNCRNYIQLEPTGGILRCISVLEETKPDYLATGHWGIWEFTPENAAAMRRWAEGLRPRFERLIAWDDPNFGMDENWVSLFPYYSEVKQGESVKLQMRVRNHGATTSKMVVRLSSQSDLSIRKSKKSWTIKAKKDGSKDFRVRVPKDTPPGRYIVVGDITRNSTRLGQLCEAIVDVK